MNNDLISRQDAIDALEEQLDYLQMLNKNENPTAEGKWYGVNWARNTIADLPYKQNKRPKESELVKAYLQGFNTGVEIVKNARLQGERAERALAIIDRLRTDGHINNKEQGTLRRAILLPERPQGEWITVSHNCWKCPYCQELTNEGKNFCPNCGAYMRGENNG